MSRVTVWLTTLLGSAHYVLYYAGWLLRLAAAPAGTAQIMEVACSQAAPGALQEMIFMLPPHGVTWCGPQSLHPSSDIIEVTLSEPIEDLHPSL